MIVAGIILFFSRKFKIEKWHYPLLFIFSILIAISLWRMPVVFDRRYALPTLVPGIVISVYLIMLLPDILKCFKVKFAVAIVRIAVVILLIVCIAKTLRFQESKPYLYEIPEALITDCVKNKISENVILLIFGKPGGHWKFEHGVNVVEIGLRSLNRKFADVEYQFDKMDKSFNLKHLGSKYPHIYLLCVEKQEENFSLAWREKYNEPVELIYEYIRNKDNTTLRLYRIKSYYRSDIPEVQLDKLMTANNLIRNYDFSHKYCVDSSWDSVRILEARGLSIFSKGNIYLPDGWRINQYQGWKRNSLPIAITVANGALHVKSNGLITLYLSSSLKSKQNYLVSVEARLGKNGRLGVFAYTYDSKGTYLETVLLQEINCNFPCKRYVFPVKLSEGDAFKLAFAFSGDVVLGKIGIIEANN
ncbi:MAG: hypothetical protein WC071_07920 [Victivallaceae bacterium]